MKLSRILQLLVTAFLASGITIISQLLVPPFFLHYYANGIEVYGEWIALSASVTYLGTLNYGIQTYANNQTTILYNRGEVEAAKTVQASAFRLLILIFLIFAAGGLCVFFLPIASMLKLRHETSAAAALTLYLLILQIAFNMMFSLLANGYMVVGKLHRGSYFQSAQRLTMILSMALALYLRAPFPVLAAIQLGSLVLFFLIIMADVRRVAPVLLPSLRYGSWRQVTAILKPSGHFGLIALAGFLTWQFPVILIQLVLGPAAVALFSIVRVVFQMSRQVLMMASGVIGQDITLMVGSRDWRQLRRLYDLSERIVLFLIPIVSVGSLLLCPFLFTIWLHKRSLYNPQMCLLMAIVSAVLGIKEHKTQFQSSSNEHEALSVFILCGYAIMLGASIFTMKVYGLAGFIVTWLIWEVIQTAFVLRLNDRLFPDEYKITIQPIIRLYIFMAIAFALSVWPVYREANWPLGWVVAFACGTTVVFGVAAYFVFGVDEVRGVLMARLRNRFARASER
jgi:O-antigen/teichoic acid export membrane protein